MKELEAKFLVFSPGEASGVRDLLVGEGVRITEESSDEMTDRYFDTSSWDLYRHGWTYRWRKSASAVDFWA